MLLDRFADMGLEITTVSERGRSDRMRVVAPERLRSIDVATLPYPGIATDYKPLIITMLAVADGVGIVTENLYPGRFRYVEELQRLGADVRTSGHHAVVRGVPRLSGAPVRAHDIRAGAAMVVAGPGRRRRDRDHRDPPHRPRLRRPGRPPVGRRRPHRTPLRAAHGHSRTVVGVERRLGRHRSGGGCRRGRRRRGAWRARAGP